MRLLLPPLAAILLGAVACAPATQARGATVANAANTVANAAAEREVVRTVNLLFEGMRTRDTALIRRLLAPSLVLASIRADGAPAAARSQTVPEFLRAIATSPVELRERMWSPEVRLDGPIATLWAPYDFHIGETFRHCGYDAVQLVHTGGQWIVTGLTYTLRAAPCPGPPAVP